MVFCSANEDVAGTLLRNELDNYTNFVDSQNGLNNYWKQFSLLNLSTDNDPSEWKSKLPDPKVALKFLKPLPCNNEATETCINKQYSDRDVRKMIDLWKKEGTSPRTRKIPSQENKLEQNKISNENQSKFEFRQSKSSLSTGRSHNETVLVTKSNFEKSYSSKLSNFAYRSEPRPIERKEERTNLIFKNEQRPIERREERTNTVFKNEQRPVENRDLVFKNDPRAIEKKEESSENKKFSGFKTARTVLAVQQTKNNRQPPSNNRQQYVNNRQPPVKKSLGGRALNSPFVNPFKDEQPKEEEPDEPVDERFKNIEPKMIELIKNEIMDCGSPISWDDIAGLEHAKRIIKEIVVFPMLRPDIFTGLRRPPKGILLFGPPGTGKTLIGKCIASQSKSTFFSISASSLTSKWVGEGEKMVRALFAVAQVEQPSVVFIDEIDSLLCQRSETEHESSRRMKTEFLVQLDGAATGAEDRILVIGATNRPYELDEAARRRLVKRLYVPLPELEARAQIIRNLLKSERHDLTPEDVYEIARLANGYSGADMTNLCKEASMGPIRSIPFEQLEGISKDDVRKVTLHDFKEALDAIRPSVSQKDLAVYIDWDRTYGTGSVYARG